MNDMLDNACPNGGENKFYFESHCVRWCVEAVKVGGEWIIKSAEAEPW
jgi:hypothetical protein